MQLEVPIGGNQVMPRRHLAHAVVQRARLRPAEFDRVRNRIGVPTRRHAGRKQCFDFRGEIQRAIVPRVEQRLDAEPIAHRHDRAVALVPQHHRELAAQAMHALHADVFVQMQGDLAVRSRSQEVSAPLELVLDCLEIVELAVDDDPSALVFASDGLIAGREIDDAQPRMAKGHSPVGGYPVALSVGSPMVKAPSGSFNRGRRDGCLTGKDGSNAAHIWRSLSGSASSSTNPRRSRGFRVSPYRQARKGYWTSGMPSASS